MFKNPFSFEGRIRRTEYGYTLIIYTLVHFFSSTIHILIYKTSLEIATILYFSIFLISLWFLLAQNTKRCHDLGKSGWWQLIPFYALWLIFQDSDQGQNQYGDNPKGVGNNTHVYNTSNRKNDVKTDNPEAKKGLDNYFLSAFGLFGVSNAFQQSFWLVKKKEMVTEISPKRLNLDAIQVFPDTKLYSIEKDFSTGQGIISYNLYSYINGTNYEKVNAHHHKRESGYLGVGIYFLDYIAYENTTIACLEEFHANLLDKNIEEGKLIVESSNSLSVSKPSNVNRIPHNLKKINPNIVFTQTTNKNLVVYADISLDNLQKLFKSAINMLNLYDKIYFTNSEAVATYVQQQGIYNVTDQNGFEQQFNKTMGYK